MASVQHRTWANRLSKRAVRIFLGTAALAAFATPARADVCFPTPIALPRLSGVPLWEGSSGVVRTELNEPRWAAAPLTQFDNDITGEQGLYRLLVDSSYSQLVVSFQAPTDPGVPSGADEIFFGFTTDGTGGSLARAIGIQVNGVGSTDPLPATTIVQQTYNSTTGWSAFLGAPAWLKDAAVWRNTVSGDAAWGINFKIDLTGAGLSAENPFKIQLAMRKENESAATAQSC
jgi:hypothetical protein